MEKLSDYQEKDINHSILSVGLIGHHDIIRISDVKYILNSARYELSALKVGFNEMIALTSLDIGADTIMAKVALELNALLYIVVPHNNYHEIFSRDQARTIKALMKVATKVIELPYLPTDVNAYIESGKWIVDNSDVLLAVWDGLPARIVGGTGDIVSYALEINKKVVLIPFIRDAG